MTVLFDLIESVLLLPDTEEQLVMCKPVIYQEGSLFPLPFLDY